MCLSTACDAAQGRSDISCILDAHATAGMKSEVKELLKLADSSDAKIVVVASKRLFELFLQREDMAKFGEDFREIEAFLGPMNEADRFDWSQFTLDTEEDVRSLQAESKRLQNAKVQSMLEVLRGKNGPADAAEIVVDLDEDAEDADGNPLEKDDLLKDKRKVKVALVDANNLTDSSGNVWSGVILDTDMVQKTTPGQRVLSHRALVVVGNNRGTAGFGMGKGQTPADALNSAFR